MSETLQGVIADILKMLAEFFGTTVEAVSAEFPAFLAKYGWYDTITFIPLACLLGILFGAGLYFLFYYVCDGDVRFPKLLCFGCVILCTIIAVILSIAPVWVAPEIVGLKALLEDLELIIK